MGNGTRVGEWKATQQKYVSDYTLSHGRAVAKRGLHGSTISIVVRTVTINNVFINIEMLKLVKAIRLETVFVQDGNNLSCL